MLESNTKAVVIASSAKRNIGPKRGSTGYIINSVDPVYVKKLPIADGVAISLTDILFIRYGFGRERVAERRQVLNLFPTFIKPLQKEKSISKEMDKLFHNFNKHKFDEEPWFGIKASQANNPSKLTVAILAPLKSTGEDLVSCSKTEFEAWFNSYAMNAQLNIALSKMCNEPFHTRLPLNADHKTLLRIFKDYSSSKPHKKALMEHVLNDDSIRKTFIKAIVLAKSVAVGRNECLSATRALKVSSMFNGASDQLCTTRFINHFTNRLFSRKLTYLKKEEVIKVTHGSKLGPKKVILDQLMETIDFLRLKADEIEKGPHGSQSRFSRRTET